MDRRRLILSGLAAGAAAVPGLAQQPMPRRIGMLINGGPGPVHEAWRRTFAQDFAAAGFREGPDFVVEPLFAEGRLARLPDLAADHVRQGVTEIVALGGPAASAAMRATTTIPVVFAIVTDPVALGLVDTMQRPGRNLTGITSWVIRFFLIMSGSAVTSPVTFITIGILGAMNLVLLISCASFSEAGRISSQWEGISTRT